MSPRADMTSRLRLTLRSRDIDRLGHLTHSVYHDFLAEGRTQVIYERSPERFDFVLVRVELDYLREVRHAEGYVDVVSAIAGVGTSSVTITQSVRLPDDTPAARARSVVVAWDPDRRAKRRLDDSLRTALGAATP